jgi:hypothetical protein
MKLSPGTISSKVRNSALTGALTVLVVTIASQSPLKNNPWMKLLQNPEVATSLVVVASSIAGYASTEKAFSKE